MRSTTSTQSPNAVDVVAIKAFGRIAQIWDLSQAEAAALIGMAEHDWTTAQASGFDGTLIHDQLLSLSALIGIYAALNQYFSDPLSKTWFTSPNTGPLFHGARPADVAIKGGLPKLLAIRTYIGALCGGS